MALKLELLEEPERSEFDWLRPVKSKYMYSDAARQFRKTLERYVDGEVPGRAVLVSGPRGSGKTTMVERVVRDVAQAGLSDLAKRFQEGGNRFSSRPRLTRPLLVKLHGPSMIGVAVVTPAATETPAPADAKPAAPAAAPPAKEPRANQRPVAVASVLLAPSPEAKPEKPKDADKKADLAETALKQISIALYRALADEFAESYAYQANQASQDKDRLYEIAGQFRLDLDQGAQPRALREYFHSVDCLKRGVLWPRLIGAAAIAAGAEDRGVLEMQALSTAAQTYRVCSGAVVYKETVKDDWNSESRREAKLALDLGKFGDRAVALGLGGLLGWGLSGGPAGAAVGAAAVGAVSSAWSFEQSRKRALGQDYEFIRDNDLGTLERDLPLVIERIRRAGLAPVFVIDELDKVKDPKTTIANLIARLKHLTTDRGFFCFLTGADYFDYVENEIEARSYPPEHTFFSERLFIVYQPLDFVLFLRRLIVSTEDQKPSGEPRDPNVLARDYEARAILVRLAMYRSKFNVVALLRELNGLFERGTPASTSAVHVHLEVAVQLAVEVAFAMPRAQRIVEADSLMRQLAIEVAYHFSRHWEEGETKYSAAQPDVWNDVKLWLDLESNGGVESPPSVVRARDLIAAFARPDRLVSWRLLSRRVNAYLQLQQSAIWAALPQDGEASGQPAATQLTLSSLIGRLPGSGLVARAKRGARDHYQILYDRYGGDPSTGALLDQGAALPAKTTRRMKKAEAAIAAFRDLISEAELEIADLTPLGVLTGAANWATLEAIAEELEAALHDNEAPSDLEDLLIQAETFAAKFEDCAAELVGFLELLLRLRQDLGDDWDTPTVLSRLARYVELRNIGLGLDVELPDVDNRETLRAAADAQRSLATYKENKLSKLDKRDAESSIDPAWDRWFLRTIGYLRERGQRLDPPLAYEDFLLLAAEREPATVFQASLDDMTLADWSKLCLHAAWAVETNVHNVPAWALLAALDALGFGTGAIALAELEVSDYDKDKKASQIAQLSRGRGRSGKGVAAIVASVEPGATVHGVGQPAILVTETQLGVYDSALDWLARTGIVEEVLNEL